ncbi:unnamed protein product [Tilletia controversa]|nr:unnamed protein product [Tilletia controversa]CAD6922325.1 unnamed protein product [Tilletia controversa]CAD6934071.1 unnamed protein product [Tilletia controversa]CAD7066631.1 unnamed protein product [Tilletia caries]
MTKANLKAMVTEPITVLPAVVLGLLLNLLDGVSYGMIPSRTAIRSLFTLVETASPCSSSSPHEVALWSIPLELAILLRIITARFNHPLVVHAYFVIRPAVFFAVTLPFGFSLARLQSSGRVFDIGRAAHAPFWRFYTYFDLTQTSSMALVATMPTQFALVFLSVLHPPLNIPALAVSVGQDDVNTDRELTAHGWSNIIADAHVLIPALCFFIAGKYLQA